MLLFLSETISYCLLAAVFCLFTNSCKSYKFFDDDALFYEANSNEALINSGLFVSLNIKEDGSPVKPGACYARSILVDCEVRQKQISYFKFTGNPDEEDVDLEEREFLIKKGEGTSWVKKKAVQNCLSNDPEDCMVWCLVQDPDVVETQMVLTDTTQTKNFEEVFIQIPKSEINESEIIWTEVICDTDVKPYLYEDLSNRLYELGYLDANEIDDRFTTSIQAALKAFQQDECLPMGQLSLDTFERLDLEY